MRVFELLENVLFILFIQHIYSSFWNSFISISKSKWIFRFKKSHQFRFVINQFLRCFWFWWFSTLSSIYFYRLLYLNIWESALERFCCLLIASWTTVGWLRLCSSQIRFYQSIWNHHFHWVSFIASFWSDITQWFLTFTDAHRFFVIDFWTV